MNIDNFGSIFKPTTKTKLIIVSTNGENLIWYDNPEYIHVVGKTSANKQKYWWQFINHVKNIAATNILILLLSYISVNLVAHTRRKT